MIYIVPDSNLLHVSFGTIKTSLYGDFHLNQSFEKLIKLRDSDACNDTIQVLIPEMVLRELIEQKCTQYEKDIEAYNMIALRMGKVQEAFEPVSSYRNSAFEQAKVFLATKSVNIIPICGSTYWNYIVDKAILKEAPFEGKEGKADKGFKDTVIFFSIIEYAQKNKGSYYFLTKDGVFSGKAKNGSINRLQKEFFYMSGSSFHVITDIEELERRILRKEPGEILNKLNYTMKAEKIKIDGDSSEVPVNIIQEVPLFTGDSVIEAMINEEISSQWNKFMMSWCEIPREWQPWEADMVYEGSFIVTVTYNMEHKISIHFYEYRFVGGVHGGSEIYAYTYDLKEGKLLSLTEALGMDEESVLKLVNECIANDMEDSKAGKYYEKSVNITDIENIIYYLKDEKVHIVFNEYELGPYASGIIDLVLCDCKKQAAEG